MPRLIPIVLLFPILIPVLAHAQADIKIADFESAGYPPDWAVTGTAFGSGPAQATLPNQQPVSGIVGTGYLNSYHGGDDSKGTLQSAAFAIQRPYINFLAGGGNHPLKAAVELVVDGKTVLSATGNHNEAMYWRTWDVTAWQGKTAFIRLVDDATGDWGHILADEFSQSGVPKAFQEPLRPQFHFTPPHNWINDPNGLVYYGGEYHFFYQHNPYGMGWGNIAWGHAVSPDMVHWQHLPVALEPDNAGCLAYSGSAVVDWENTAGFQTGAEKTLIIFWTSFGCGQRLAYSNDRGRTWTKWSGNPLIPNEGEMRDPKVYWHAPSRKWVMAVWTDTRGGGISFWTSPNLKTWSFSSILGGFFECPDYFELAVDGNPSDRRWVLHAAAGDYILGAFDGTRFVKQAGPFKMDYGRNWYASQSFADIPAADGRRINISWMREASFPGMPFNGQMSLPTSLALKTLPDGVRLTRLPVKELDVLRLKTDAFKDRVLSPGQNPLAGITGDLFDIQAEFETGGASEFGIKVRGSTVAYKVGARTLGALDRTAPLSPVGNRVKVRVIVDRASLEVFGNDGAVVLTGSFIPPGDNHGLEAYAVGGDAKIVSLDVHHLRGAWNPKDLRDAWERSKVPSAVAPRTAKAEGPGWTRALIRRGAFDALGRITPLRPRRNF